jgi:hypothetical protein
MRTLIAAVVLAAAACGSPPEASKSNPVDSAQTAEPPVEGRPANNIPADFSYVVHEGPVGDTIWIVAVFRTGAGATVRFGYTLGRSSSDFTQPTAVLDSVVVKLEANEIPYSTCGEVGRTRRGLLAFANRGPDDPVARLAWRPTPATGRLVPVPATEVQCSSEY